MAQGPYMIGPSLGLVQGLVDSQRQKGLASGLSNYYAAQDDAGKRAALSQIAQYDPSSAMDLMNKQSGKDWTTDLGRMWNIANDKSQPEENRNLAKQYLSYVSRDPMANQNWSYGGRIGQLQGDLALGGQVEAQKTLGREQAQEQTKRANDYNEAMDEYNALANTYNTLFGDDGLVKKALIGYGRDGFWGGSAGYLERNFPTNLLTEDQQKARQQIVNTMGQLRLDQMKYLKGAISDKEQAMLAQIVAGDLTKNTPYEMEGTFKAMMDRMLAKANSLKAASRPVGEDPQEDLKAKYGLEE